MANHLNIGAIIYPEMDQIDFTGPFEVLSRLPDPLFTVAGSRWSKGTMKQATPVGLVRKLPDRDPAAAP
jgi:cyclohexyl-isocyanide hydratase